MLATFLIILVMLRRYITSCLYLLLKSAAVKLFGKQLTILGTIATFYPYQVFPFEFCKIFINSRFSEIVGKKKVLGGSSFDDFFFDTFIYK